MASPGPRLALFRACLVLALVALPALAQAQDVSYYNGRSLTVWPSSVPSGQTTVVSVQLLELDGTAAVGRKISLCGSSLDNGFPSTPPSNLSVHGGACPHYAWTQSDGTAVFTIRPFTTSGISVYVDDTYAYRSIPVTAGALQVYLSPSSPTTADVVTVTVALPDGSLSSGSSVRLYRDGSLAYGDLPTDWGGRVTFTALEAGSYEARASRNGYTSASAFFSVQPAPQADLQVASSSVPTTSEAGKIVQATVTVENRGNAAGSGTARLLVNSVLRDSRAVTLAPGSSTSVVFEFTPTSAGTFTVRFTIGNSTSPPYTLRVEARPTFLLRSISVPSTAVVGDAFDVGATVENPSNVDGWARVDLNMTGRPHESRDVYVRAGTAQTVTFSVVAASEGRHEAVFSLGGASSSAFVDAVPPRASFSLSRLSAPSAAEAGAPYEVSVVLQNDGRASGVATVVLLRDGVREGSLTRTLAPGERASLTFRATAPSTAGSYALRVETDGAVLAAPSSFVVSIPRLELRAPNGTTLAGASAVLLGAGSDGALVSKGAVRADARGQIAVDRAKASHVAIPDGDGFTIVPVPASGRIVLPASLTTSPATFDESARIDLAARFQDARVFPVGGTSRRVTVGYAGVDSVDVETSTTDARLVVTRFNEKPLASLPAPPGQAVQWFELHLTRTDGADAALTRATVRFARPVGAEGVPVLFHYRAATGAWEVLAAEEVDGALVATVGGFSLFAIGTKPATLFDAPWVLPVVAGAGILALVGVAAVVAPRLAKRAKAKPPTALPVEATPVPVVEAAPPPPPPPVERRHVPRRPLAGDVVLQHASVRTGGKTFLEDVSFRAPRGALTSIVGPAGAGKAMTLLTILGEAPHLGDVDVGGMRPSLDQADLRRSVGAAAGGARLDRERVVEEIFDAIADKRQLPRIDARMRGERALSLLGGSATGGSRVADLGTADERRVLIAAALVHEPELLLLDEPTQDLAPEERRELWEGIRRLKEQLGLTVIATSPYADDARGSDHVVMLEGGRLVATGTPTELASLLGRGSA